MKKWITLSSKLAFDNKWMKVQQDTVELPNGKIIDDFFMWKEGDVALIVAITDENKVVLVKQYKHGAGQVVTEVPAGYIEEGESIEEGAKRELKEETGYTADNFQYIAKLSVSPTKIIGNMHIFLATNAKLTSNTIFDEDEEIEIILKSPSEVVDMIVNGEIIATAVISAVFLAFKKVGYL